MHTLLLCEKKVCGGFEVTLCQLAPFKSSCHSCTNAHNFSGSCVFAAVVMANENQHPQCHPTWSPPKDNCSLSQCAMFVRVCVSGWGESDRFAVCLWSSEVTLRVYGELSLISQWQLSPVLDLKAGRFRNGNRNGGKSRLNILISHCHRIVIYWDMILLCGPFI